MLIPLLVKAGSGALTHGRPDSAGVPEALANLTITVPFNDLPAVREAFAANKGEISAIILEPIQCRALSPGAGISGRTSGALRHGRFGPDFRRGDDRISGCSGRRARTLRRLAGLDGPGEGDRRRGFRRRLWRALRDHGRPLLPTVRFTGPELFRKPSWRGGRPGANRRTHPTRRLVAPGSSLASNSKHEFARSSPESASLFIG